MHLLKKSDSWVIMIETVGLVITAQSTQSQMGSASVSWRLKGWISLFPLLLLNVEVPFQRLRINLHNTKIFNPFSLLWLFTSLKSSNDRFLLAWATHFSASVCKTEYSQHLYSSEPLDTSSACNVHIWEKCFSWTECNSGKILDENTKTALILLPSLNSSSC